MPLPLAAPLVRASSSNARLLPGFAGMLALLLAVSGFSGYSYLRLQQAEERNAHSFQVLQTSDALLEALLNMETGERGYQATGDPAFLQPYRAGERAFRTQWAAERDLTADRPTQTRRLDDLLQQERFWQSRLMEPALAARGAARTPPQALAAATANAVELKARMDGMRATLARIDGTEQGLRRVRAERQRLLGAYSLGGLVLGTLASLLVFGVLCLVAVRNAARSDAAGAELARANAELAQRNAQFEMANVRLEEEVAQRREAQARLDRSVAELKRSNDDLEQFAYVASHDLQEPLRAVGGCVQVLQRRYAGKLDERADTLVQHAVEGAKRMQNLINDLLAYSRLGTRGAPMGPVKLEEVLVAVKRSLRVALEESEAQLTSDPLPEVMGDRPQLEQVMQNLVANALKFREAEPPRVHVGCAAGKIDDEPAWIVSVRDHGPGIEAQYFDRIFVMFQRLHTRTEYEGTGIGLAVCKKIVERHGGRIWVESEMGQGATFFFSLPQEVALDSGAAEHPGANGELAAGVDASDSPVLAVPQTLGAMPL